MSYIDYDVLCFDVRSGKSVFRSPHSLRQFYKTFHMHACASWSWVFQRNVPTSYRVSKIREAASSGAPVFLSWTDATPREGERRGGPWTGPQSRLDLRAQMSLLACVSWESAMQVTIFNKWQLL